MNLYLVSRDEPIGYDEFDSMLVAAESEDDARSIHPYGLEYSGDFWNASNWVHRESVEGLNVEKIGVADEGIKRKVIIASFNAG